MRTGTKSDLIGCLEGLIPSQENVAEPSVQVIILDGAAIVNMLRPGHAKTFAEYSWQNILPYVISQLDKASRVDIVWDQYFPA